MLQPMAFAIRIRCVQYSAGIRAGCSSQLIAWNGAPSSRKSVAPSANVRLAMGVPGVCASSRKGRAGHERHHQQPLHAQSLHLASCETHRRPGEE